MRLTDKQYSICLAGTLIASMFWIVWILKGVRGTREMAEIEQVRAEVAPVAVKEPEDFIGQAVEWNQHIKLMQAYNRKWWAAWVVPNAWDRVEIIKLPDRR